MFLAEKGIEIPTVQVDLAAGEQRKPEFLALNPLGAVPVLELDDGTAIAESGAICRYIEAQHPEPPLWGRDPVTIARVEMWHRRVELKLYLAVQDAVRNGHAAFAGSGSGPNGEQKSEVAEAGKRDAEQFCDWLDQELGARRFVAGEAFSIADVALLAAVDFARLAKLRLREGRPHMGRWYDEVAARESAKA